MRKRWMALLVCVSTGMLQAQELVPELAESAAKYKAVIEALREKKAEAVGKAAQSYVNALDGIEKSATAKGDVDLIAAVVKERESAVAGLLEDDLPAALPKVRLYGARKALQKNLKKIGEDFARKGKQADADYLRALAGLQTKAAPGSELATQVAAEKAAVLAGGASVANGAAKGKKVSRGKNVVVNGDFEKVDAGGKPEGWDTNNGLITENNNMFVRIEETASNADGTARRRTIKQEIPFPNKSKSAKISARVRAEVDGNFENRKKIGVYLEFLNSENKPFRWICPVFTEKNGVWSDVCKEEAIPSGAVSCAVIISNDTCPGRVDVDDVFVSFK